MKLTNKYIESWYYRTLPVVDLDDNGKESQMSFTKWKASVRKDLNKLLKEAEKRGREEATGIKLKTIK